MTTSTPEVAPLSPQADLEVQCLRTGITSYRNRVQRLQNEKGQAALLPPVQHFVKLYIDPVRNGLIQWITEARKRPGRQARALKYLELGDADVSALIALKTALNTVMMKTSVQNVAIHIGESIQMQLMLDAFEAQNGPLYRAVDKHIKDHPLSYRESYRTGVWKNALRRYKVLWDPWSREVKASVGMALLDLVIKHTGALEIVRTSGKRRNTLRVLPTKEFVDWLTANHERCELLHPPCLPMVEPPLVSTNLQDGGFHTPQLRRPLVKRHQDLDMTAENTPLVYRALNGIAAVPWHIDERVYRVIDHLAKIRADIPGCAVWEDYELPIKPPADAPRSVRERYKREAREVNKKNLGEQSRRLDLAVTLSVARRFLGFDLWYSYFMDFRGRMYPDSPYLNPQGNDLSKGLLRFRNGVQLGPEGLWWLKVHTANCFGIDKVSMEERVAWVDTNMPAIKRVAADPLAETWWHEADGPVQFLAACFEVATATPESISFIPVRLDGTCNGTQHLAALILDEQAGKLVNLVPAEKPSDIYAAVAAEVVECLTSISSSVPSVSSSGVSSSAGASVSSLSTDAAGPRTAGCRSTSVTDSGSVLPFPGTTDASSSDQSVPPASTLAAKWLEYGISRGICKRPQMIQPYNGTRMAVERYIKLYLDEQERDGKRHPFGDFKNEAVVLLRDVMWDAMSKIAPGPRAVMNWSREVAKVYNKELKAIPWVSPSGFKVNQMYVDKRTRIVKTRMGDSTMKVTVLEPTDKLDTRTQAQALAPNWIHSLDAAAMHLTVCGLLDAGVTDFVFVHDSFGTHAAHAGLLAEKLREVFVKIYSEDQIKRMIDELSKSVEREKLPAPPTKGTLNINGVMKSRYFFA